MRDVIVLGSGPAGLTAAIYLARADYKPLVIEGHQPGGLLTITTEVENYPGFSEGIFGQELMDNMSKQAARFGAEFVSGSATSVELSSYPFKVWVNNDQWYETKSIIIATGASARNLGLPNEKRLIGRGVSYCATCDGFFFRGKRVAVVGGGDSAMEDALFLTKFAESVSVIHRRDQLRASPIMQKRAQANPKINFIWNSVIQDILGEQRLESLVIKNLQTDEASNLPVDGLFVAIGHAPNTLIFQGVLPLDQEGFIQTLDHTSKTVIPGVFVAGDVKDKIYRQAITAAGSGCMAALDCQRWLEDDRE
jgi:thioredoxin reductase (NADPH)